MPHGTGLISFPGLGIHDLDINRVAFTIFGRDIYWYGIFIAMAFFLGVMIASNLAKKSGLNPDCIIDMALITTPVAVIGARAYYVLTTLDQYDSFYEMIAIWNGGIAIYGAILAGLPVVAIFCKVKKIPLLTLLDCVAPALILGQCIGRWGNFVNQEAFGEATTLPWGMELLVDGTLTTVHPTFFYESLWNGIGFLLLMYIFKKKTWDGKVFWSYMGWYGFGRFFIEGLRVDSLYVGTFRISQIVAVVAVAFAIVMIARGGNGKRLKTSGGDSEGDVIVPSGDAPKVAEQTDGVTETTESDDKVEAMAEEIKSETTAEGSAEGAQSDINDISDEV